MEIKHIEGKQGGNLKFSIDGTIMYFWDSFKRSIISLDGFAQSHNFNRVMFSDTSESITKWVEQNEDFVCMYIQKAKAEESVAESFRKIPVKKLVGELEGSVLIVSIDLSRAYVAVTAHQVYPVPEDTLIQQGSETLIDHFVHEQNMSKKKAKEKVAEMVRYGGVEEVADISLFPQFFDLAGVTYTFDSSSCGCLHKEIKRTFPDNKPLNKLIGMHLKKDADLVEAMYLYSEIKGSENYKEEGIELGKKIILGK